MKTSKYKNLNIALKELERVLRQTNPLGWPQETKETLRKENLKMLTGGKNVSR
jgi:hypothetical protein